MRILMFVENNHSGGMDSFFVNLINHWPHADDELVLIYNYDHSGGAIVERGVGRPCTFVPHHIPLHWRVVEKHFGWMPRQLRMPLRYLVRICLVPLQVRRLKALFGQLGGDRLLVVNGAYPGGESCRVAALSWQQLGKPACVFNIRNFAVPPRRFTGLYENALDSRVIAASSCFIGVSRACAESLRLRREFVHLENIRHVYNGVAPRTQAPDSALDLRSMFGIREGPVCLMLATYEPRKGHRFLFEAFERVKAAVPDAQLVVCGDGTPEEREAVEQLRASSPVATSIHLGDFIPNGPDLISQAEVLLVASQEWESFGWTVIEGMVRGVPVVSTNVGGLPEVVGPNGVAGYTTSPDDPSGFAHHVIDVLTNAAERKRMGLEGKKRVAECFSVSRMAREYADAIRSDAP